MIFDSLIHKTVFRIQKLSVLVYIVQEYIVHSVDFRDITFRAMISAVLFLLFKNLGFFRTLNTFLSKPVIYNLP